MSTIQEVEDDDARLLGQVLAFLALLLCSFVENGLGYFPGLYGSVPKLTVAVLFVLLLNHPAVIPVLSVVLVGLVNDLVQGSPLGYSSGLLLVAHGWIVFRLQTLAQTDSGSVWYEFTILMAALTLLMLCAMVVYSGTLPALQPLVFQFGLTVLVLPVVNWVYLVGARFAAILERLG